jgi:NAD(P)-dependent dehydrogenase (short-subunit alcohol dehydrogenase family)
LEVARVGYDALVNYAGNREAALETKALVEGLGRRAEICQANVARREDADRLVAFTLETFGRIDLLVNNAGVAPKVRADLLEATPESYDEVLATNLRGPYFLTQTVAHRMIEMIRSGLVSSPRIVNISSLSVYTSSPSRGEYCISKAGVGMMTKLFADRLAEYGITVNEVQPGIVETDMTGPVRAKYDRLIAEGLTPIRRWGRPEDVGKAVAAVAAGYFDFTTGAVIPVDGGFHLRRL